MNSTEVAKLAQVSRSTVSRVINGYPNISPKTRERVEHIIREQNYVPDAAARSLVGKNNKIIGLFIVDTEDSYDEYTICRSPFYYDYIAFSVDVANRLGYQLLITVIRHENIGNISRLFSNKTISGGIIMGDYLEDETMRHMVTQEHKLVLYNQISHSTSPNVITVNYDDFKCGKMAGEELIKRGHTRIACITGDEKKLCSSERLRGLCEAMRFAGLEFDDAHYLGRGAFHRESGGYMATKELLKRNREQMPTAICAASSSIMMGALQAIQDLGLRVPEDISLIGIDGIDLAKYTKPTLTEVEISRKTVAKLTISKLIQLLEDGSLEQNDYEIASAELVVRDSVRQLN